MLSTDHTEIEHLLFKPLLYHTTLCFYPVRVNSSVIRVWLSINSEYTVYIFSNFQCVSKLKLYRRQDKTTSLK